MSPRYPPRFWAHPTPWRTLKCNTPSTGTRTATNPASTPSLATSESRPLPHLDSLSFSQLATAVQRCPVPRQQAVVLCVLQQQHARPHSMALVPFNIRHPSSVTLLLGLQGAGMRGTQATQQLPIHQLYPDACPLLCNSTWCLNASSATTPVLPAVSVRIAALAQQTCYPLWAPALWMR
jgi:hypothetical protein